MMHRTESFARRQPALFFGGAVVAGFALTRFLRSSAERQSTYREDGEDELATRREATSPYGARMASGTPSPGSSRGRSDHGN